MNCPKCGSSYGKCPECSKRYQPLGAQSHCDEPKCVEANAPIDCARCARTVSSDKKGVLDFDSTLIPWR